MKWTSADIPCPPCPLGLSARVRAMATRWQYSQEELLDALAGAAADPAGWTSVVQVDELRFLGEQISGNA